MTADELRKRNFDFIKKNNEFIGNMMKIEDAIIEGAEDIFPGIKIPKVAYTMADKVNELFTTMESTEEPLDQKVVIITEIQYFLITCQIFMQKVDNYIKKYIVAKEKKYALEAERKRIEENHDNSLSSEEIKMRLEVIESELLIIKKEIELLEAEKKEYEDYWTSIDNDMREIDYYTVLDRIVEFEMPLPKNISPEIAIKVCKAELKKANYHVNTTENIEKQPN